MASYSCDDFMPQGTYEQCQLFHEYILEIDEQEEADEIGEVSNSALTFSAEEDLLLSRRFENGYDLPDPKYIRCIIQLLQMFCLRHQQQVSLKVPVYVNLQSSPVVENSTPHHSVAQPPTDPALTD